jgi:hypothetical protein
MITGSNLFELAVTYRPRLTQFSKLIYATVVLKVLLQSLNLKSFPKIDETSKIMHSS